MSTFDGFIKEFPQITVDHFTRKPLRPIPRAAFLSHVHRDHCCGLETYDSSFIYCSHATKKLILGLQTKRDRLHLAENLIERKKCTYANLNYKKDLLRPLPYNTPTEIEVGDSTLRVTLFDANHCPGSCMFLFENEATAVLYSGDIRAEPWWVRNLSISPVLLPYTTGIKPLNCLYLDTTFASNNEATKDFPTRAEALSQLIKDIKKYPASTVFHFNAWTFGYEDLWVAIASALNCQIHVDRYRYELYRSISSSEVWTWGPFLGGHPRPCKSCKKEESTSHYNEGKLTDNDQTHFHSCESRGKCPTRDAANIVQIIPITSTSPCDIKESHKEAEEAIQCAGTLEDMSPASKRRYEEDSLDRSPKRMKGEIVKEPGHTLLIPNGSWWTKEGAGERPPIFSEDGVSLPYLLHVRLPRHSSLNELREFVALFKPLDLHPCVEDPKKLTYLDLEGCFGDICDLSSCSYLKSKAKVSEAVAKAALETVLAEQWAYDDISDVEELEEDRSTDSQVVFDKGYSQGVVDRSFKVAGKVIQMESSTVETDDDSLTADDESGDPEVRSLMNFSQESQSYLWGDGSKADLELVSQYIHLAQKGESILLKSVGAIEEISS